MQVRSDRRHRFAVEPETIWAAMLDLERYPEWWPWLRGFEADELAPGQEWSCLVQPPVPYSVRFTIAIERVVTGERVEATVGGDIVGTAQVSIAPRSDGCEARLVADLAPASGLLRTMGVVARPIVRLAHDWVLDSGARQFRSRAL